MRINDYSLLPGLLENAGIRAFRLTRRTAMGIWTSIRDRYPGLVLDLPSWNPQVGTGGHIIIEGAKARDHYSEIEPCEYDLMFVQGGGGVRCERSSPPDLHLAYLDIVVAPLDLAWVMVFSHEGPLMGWGPLLVKLRAPEVPDFEQP